VTKAGVDVSSLRGVTWLVGLSRILVRYSRYNSSFLASQTCTFSCAARKPKYFLVPPRQRLQVAPAAFLQLQQSEGAGWPEARLGHNGDRVTLAFLHPLLGDIASREFDPGWEAEGGDLLEAVFHGRSIVTKHIKTGAVSDEFDLHVLAPFDLYASMILVTLFRARFMSRIVLIHLNGHTMRFGAAGKAGRECRGQNCAGCHHLEKKACHLFLRGRIPLLKLSAGR
jgi:hypothetical protein